MRPAIYLIAVLLSACSFSASTSITATPLPTLQVLEVVLTPTLRPIKPALKTCAKAHSQVALVIHEQQADAIDLNNADLVFRLGEAANTPPFVAGIAIEHINIVVHPDNPISSLTSEEIQSLYIGSSQTWKHTGETVEVWASLPGSELRSFLDDTILDGKKLTPFAHLAPLPETIVDAISQDPYAIGLLPGAWIENNVKSVQIEPILANLLQQPVLAISKSQFKEIPQAILTCMQSGNGQLLLQDKYQRWKP